MKKRRIEEQAFTMIEIAFSLAIVAFALVAIMGVLPMGMTVQRDNREDTLINNDAMFWAESLRSGSRGLDDLTNYVEEIMISNSVSGILVHVTNSWDINTKIFSGEQIVGLLSTPKYTNTSVNSVWARVRAINGPAVDKVNPKGRDFAFRYRLESEVTPVVPAPINTTVEDHYANSNERDPAIVGSGEVYERAVATNLTNLRLTFRWPLYERGATWDWGNNRRTVRSQFNGQLGPLQRDVADQRATNYYFAHPNTFQYVSIQPQPEP